jgi:hypothetical protein
VLWIQYGEVETGPLRFDVTILTFITSRAKLCMPVLSSKNNIRNVSYRIPNNFCVTVSGGHRVEPLPPVLQSPGVSIRILSVGNTTISRRGGHFRPVWIPHFFPSFRVLTRAIEAPVYEYSLTPVETIRRR